MTAKRKTDFLEPIGLAVLAILLVVVVPCLNALPEDNSFYLSEYYLTLLGKFLCYAIAALGINLIWGYTGILSLGQGVFFALGGYCMGMYLMLAIGEEGHYASDLPDFMVFLDWESLPWYWPPFRNFWFAAAAALWLPMLFATVFGFLTFRSRIRGVYFAIVTQAATVALCLLLFRNNIGLGGNNGLTDFKSLLGFDLQNIAVKRGLYVASAVSLVLWFVAIRLLIRTKLGRILTAIRDNEGRIRFLGYSPAAFKLFVFVVAAGITGWAGALYVPQVGIINPSELEAARSIEMIIWVAVGGRGTLLGAPLGALLVNGLKSYVTAEFPDFWLYSLGGLFVVVVMFFPDGLMGLPANIGRAVKRLRRKNVPRTDDERPSGGANES